MQNCQKVHKAAEIIAAKITGKFGKNSCPETAVILGTGLGSLADELEDPLFISYKDIPDYPVSTVQSHAGRFCVGRLAGRLFIFQDGRCHLYEGYTPAQVCFGTRIMAGLGAKTLLVTNAAGSLNPLFPAGGLMLINDHINFTGQSPLTGIGDAQGRSRFTDMSAPYDPALLALARDKALQLGIELYEGVYLGLIGPQLETRAETRAFRAWGADAVGMSTVMEVIAARHLGLRVLGLSALSNQNLPDAMREVGIDEVVAVAGRAAAALRKLVAALLPEI